MTQQVAINRENTAVLIMDFQQRIINNVASDPQTVVQNASQALGAARHNEIRKSPLLTRYCAG